MEYKFYVIEVIGTNQQVGFIVPRPNGIEICIGGVIGDIGKFKTWELANRFAKKNGMFKKGVTVKIRDNQYLMDYYKGRGISSGIPMFYLQNDKGQILFYDSTREGYYWDDGKVGFPCWESEEQMQLFIDENELKNVIIKKLNKSFYD